MVLTRVAVVMHVVVVCPQDRTRGSGLNVVSEAPEAWTVAVVVAREAVVEVAGPAAVIVEDATAAAWAAAVEQAMVDGARLVALGAGRCRLFTPEISGRALADAYRMALSR